MNIDSTYFALPYFGYEKVSVLQWRQLYRGFPSEASGVESFIHSKWRTSESRWWILPRSSSLSKVGGAYQTSCLSKGKIQTRNEVQNDQVQRCKGKLQQIENKKLYKKSFSFFTQKLPHLRCHIPWQETKKCF